MFTRKHPVIVTTVILLTLARSVSHSQARSQRNSSNEYAQNAALARPIDWGSFVVRMLKTSEMKIKFTLQTSWIPGENHKGMFRYRLTAMPDTPPSYSPEETEAIMKRVHSCSILLDLYDVAGFQLREIRVPVSYGVDNDVRVQNLNANAASQMDANEYRQLVGNSKQSGSWSVSWTCGNGEP